MSPGAAWAPKQEQIFNLKDVKRGIPQDLRTSLPFNLPIRDCTWETLADNRSCDSQQTTLASSPYSQQSSTSKNLKYVSSPWLFLPFPPNRSLTVAKLSSTHQKLYKSNMYVTAWSSSNHSSYSITLYRSYAYKVQYRTLSSPSTLDALTT